MSLIWTKNGPYYKVEYENEADLESAILEVQDKLFGSNRIYLDIKKKIGAKGGVRNIPDGYLIDLSGRKPRLYVVENELAVHDPLRHIAVQILQFSLSFETEQRGVRTIIFNTLQNRPNDKSKCEKYALENEFRNLDHLLDWMVFEGPFAALVIMDDIPDNLENVLVQKFQFGVEVLKLIRYENKQGDRYYRFSPFLADISTDVGITKEVAAVNRPALEVEEVDTVVVPAREDGFKETFLAENRWYQIRIHGSMKPQIKYIAVYQVAPVSAITPHSSCAKGE